MSERKWKCVTRVCGANINAAGNGEAAVGTMESRGGCILDGELGEHTQLISFHAHGGKGVLTGNSVSHFADGSSLVCNYSGESAVADNSAEIHGTMTVVKGTGRFAKMQGKGNWKGSRRGPLGPGGAYVVEGSFDA